MPWLDRILTDRDRGASEIEATLVAALLERAEEAPELVDEKFLTAVSESVLESLPAMANLLRLVNGAWLVWETDVALAERRRRLRAEWRCALERRQHGAEGLARSLAGVLGERRRIVTLSRSGTVIATLSRLEGGQTRPEVVVGEGRPRREGREAARQLAAAGLKVWLSVDAVLPALLHGATGVPSPWQAEGGEAVVLGADAIGTGWVNKVGSYALALGAREAGVPVVVVASEEKLLAPELERLLRIPAADPAEVEAPSGATGFNVYFERVPLALITAGVLESGVHTPERLQEKARERPVSNYLRRRSQQEDA